MIIYFFVLLVLLNSCLYIIYRQYLPTMGEHSSIIELSFNENE